MKSERITSTSKTIAASLPRSFELVRATAIRLALAATVFCCTNAATAGVNDKASTTNFSPTARLRQFLQTGQASWYGLKFQGHKTSSGENFDMNALTCAHRSLPLGSWLRVTNLRNRKSVLVRVNDRGPMVDNRIIDLSYAAARAVGLGGTSKVKIEGVSPSDPELARTLISQMTAISFPQLVPLR